MSAKTISVEISKGEMFSLEPPEQVALDDIGPGGALGLWDGFGRATVRVDGRDVMILHLHRNEYGGIVLEATGENGGTLAVTVG